MSKRPGMKIAMFATAFIIGGPGYPSLLVGAAPISPGRSILDRTPGAPSAAGLNSRVWDQRDHDVGDVQATITNNGRIYALYFPCGSRCVYMTEAYLVFGCVRGVDTLVRHEYGFFSSATIQESSSHPGWKTYDPQARAEQQFYAVYTDLPEPPYDFDTLKHLPHAPIGIEVHQTSYVWSDEAAKRSILLDYWIKNVSDEPILEGAVGMYVNGDIYWSFPDFPYGSQDAVLDDVCGLLRTVPALVPGYLDTLNLAWIADSDGDPQDPGAFRKSVPNVLGVRILRAPKGGRFNFNWWANLKVPAGFDRPWKEVLNWGPRGNGIFPSGEPEGDHGWYKRMINGEIDYDQVFSALDMRPLGWAAPPDDYAMALNLADGLDTKVLLSCGPLDEIAPGDSVPFTVALMIGANFHTDPRNLADRFFAGNPQPYLDHLDFSDLVTNARAIEWIFDNPGGDSDTNDGTSYRGEAHLVDCAHTDTVGIDTIITGNVGDTTFTPVTTSTGCDSVFYKGDGIADFHLPEPPSPPEFELVTKPGKAILRWNGSHTETARDRVTGTRNFEGYRIYVGRSRAADQLSLVASWDLENFKRLVYDTMAPGGWRQDSYPMTIVQWRRVMGDSALDPLEYLTPSVSAAYRDVYLDTLRNYMGEFVEVQSRERYSYWAPEGPNRSNKFEEAGREETNLIQRVGERDTVVAGHNMTFGVYEVVLDNLQPSLQLYFAVTCFNNGDYAVKMPSLESVPAGNWKYGEPIYSADVVMDSGLHVSVYPNPYKAVYNDAFGNRTTYFAEGYEGRGKSEFTEYDRRIHFINLPDTATITIYSLFGDLIRTIQHPDKYLTTYSSCATWDLVSRNAMAVTSGIYIYRIDSKLGSQIGKIVVIK